METGLVGCEGVAGLALFLGAEAIPHRLVCQMPGDAWRMGAAGFRAASSPPGPLHTLLLRYSHAFLVLTGQGMLCNRPHGLDEQRADWPRWRAGAR